MNNAIDQQPGELNIKSPAIKYGLIGGLASIIVSLILYIANMQFETWSRWLSTGVMVAMIIFGCKGIADANRGKTIHFGKLFGGGMIVTLIIAVMSIIYFYIYMNFIETDFTGKILEISRQQMAEKGLGEEQIDRALEMSKKFMSPAIMMAFSLLGMTVVGTIASLIGAAIFKKDN